MLNAALVGTWKLVSASSSTPSGEPIEAPYGVDPVGFLTYTPEDRVAVIISYGGRKPLSLAATIEEQAEAYKTFVGYAGRYALRDGRITHFVEISSIQSFVSKELIRIIKFEGDRITLVTPPAVVNGKLQSVRLTWERLTAKS